MGKSTSQQSQERFEQIVNEFAESGQPFDIEKAKARASELADQDRQSNTDRLKGHISDVANSINIFGRRR